jgi:hypothetical protein
MGEKTEIIRLSAIQTQALLGPQLEDIKEGVRELRSETKEMRNALTEHLVADSGHKAATTAEVNGLGERLNKHLEEHARRRAWLWGLGGASIVGFLNAVWGWVSRKTG